MRISDWSSDVCSSDLWPGCYGHLTVPEAAHEVSAAQQLYPDRPIEAPKAWKEMIHRYLAETLGLFIVALALASVFIKDARRPRVMPWALVVLVICQGVLGMWRSEEHTSELQSLMRISYAVFCLKKKQRPQANT